VRTLSVPRRSPFALAATWHAAACAAAASGSVSVDCPKVRCFLNEVRTLYEQNPQEFD